MEHYDLLIIGAGAAGLMAGIWAGRTNPHKRILILEGARKLGAKILVSGGGRCNVTHYEVDAKQYAGASFNAIRKVLTRFPVSETIKFFREIGVELKQEETGKLFPVSNSSKTVLNALLEALQAVNVRIQHPRRVLNVARLAPELGQGFRVSGEWGSIETEKLIIATGGKSLPLSGSDGLGYQLAQSLGHSLTSPILPALVPLTLPKEHLICSLSGITVPATLELRSVTGKKLVSFTNSTLCTHFGLSGPSVLDISRYYLMARVYEPDSSLVINWWPGKDYQRVSKELKNLGLITLSSYLREELPERLARGLCEVVGVDFGIKGHQLTREQRKDLARAITEMELPITGHRGFNVAEVTAGGVPLLELHLDSMASRVCEGLYLCGEICDVDGRIGGFNFQWAWASGYLAGISSVK